VLSKNSGIAFSETLIEKNILSDEILGQMVARKLGYPFVILSKTAIPDEMFHVTPEKIARKHKIISFGRDEKGIKLAMSDPANKTIIEMIAKIEEKRDDLAYGAPATEKILQEKINLFLELRKITKC